MRRTIAWGVGIVALGLLGMFWIFSAKPCLACGSQAAPPPNCTVNMSAMTVRKADERKVWWAPLDQREDRTLKVYLGMNLNSGVGDVPYEYELQPTGDWMPSWMTPITGSGVLRPGENNTTVAVTIPYSTTDQGDLNLAANIKSPCNFNPPTATTKVRVNDQGPTVWPITSRTCPVAGEKPNLSFGIRNPGDKEQSYSVVARTNVKFGGDHTPNLSGSDGQAPQPGVYQFPDMKLGAGQSQELKITCETFGFCLTGSESRVDLEVAPAMGSSEQFSTAIASTNVTVRDPNASCPKLEDWWFIMPPAVLAGLIGVPVVLAMLGAGLAFRPRAVIGEGYVPAAAQQKREPKQPNTGERGASWRDPNDPKP